MADKIPSKSEIFDITQAQSESLEDFSKRFVKIENQIEKQEHRNTNQEDRNRNIIIIVLITFIAIVVSVAVEVILTTSADQGFVSSLDDKVQAASLKNDESIQLIELENSKLQNEVDDIKRNNPYLK